MTPKSRRIIRGLLRSWTAHTGTTIAMLGYLQTQDKILEKWFGPDALGVILVVVGILMVGLRAKTNQSLADRGQK